MSRPVREVALWHLDKLHLERSHEQADLEVCLRGVDLAGDTQVAVYMPFAVLAQSFQAAAELLSLACPGDVLMTHVPGADDGSEGALS